MRAIGLDVGSKTIGLAASDAGGVIALPRTVWSRRGNEVDAVEIEKLVLAEKIEWVVVGWPLELDGSEGLRVRRVARLVESMRSRMPQLAIETWDERFSTVQAERSMIEADARRKTRRASIDAVAAALILQSWLDSRQPREELP